MASIAIYDTDGNPKASLGLDGSVHGGPGLFTVGSLGVDRAVFELLCQRFHESGLDEAGYMQTIECPGEVRQSDPLPIPVLDEDASPRSGTLCWGNVEGDIKGALFTSGDACGSLPRRVGFLRIDKYMLEFLCRTARETGFDNDGRILVALHYEERLARQAARQMRAEPLECPPAL